jgi:DoxX-like family
MERHAKVIWVGRAVSVVASLPFVMSATMKLMALPEVTTGMAHLGVPEPLMRPLGVLEMLCVAVYLVPATSTLGAILFTGFVGGAIQTHLRVGENVLVQIVLGVLIWLGLYLREPRLQALLPLRRRSA